MFFELNSSQYSEILRAGLCPNEVAKLNRMLFLACQWEPGWDTSFILNFIISPIIKKKSISEIFTQKHPLRDKAACALNAAFTDVCALTQKDHSHALRQEVQLKFNEQTHQDDAKSWKKTTGGFHTYIHSSSVNLLLKEGRTHAVLGWGGYFTFCYDAGECGLKAGSI